MVPAADAGRPATVSVAGRYWGRWGETPERARVLVWIDGDTERFRGSWDLPPWHGDFDGILAGESLRVRWQQEGVVAVHQVVTRELRWTRDPRTGTFRGDDGAGGTIELSPARTRFTGLHPGAWMGRWTGLPPGLAVETLLGRESDGRWRATYGYQGREGSFSGSLRGDTLEIRWREVGARDTVSEGRGSLARTRLGYEGRYGLGESPEGAGRWTLEPL